MYSSLIFFVSLETLKENFTKSGCFVLLVCANGRVSKSSYDDVKGLWKRTNQALIILVTISKLCVAIIGNC